MGAVVAPVTNHHAFAEGMRKAVTYRLLVPLLAVLCAVFAVVWHSVGHALLQGVVGWLLITGVGYAAQIGIVRTFPFSAPLARGQTMGSIALFAAMINSVTLVLAITHFYSAHSTLFFVGYMMVSAFMVLVLRRVAQHVLQQRFDREIAHA